MRAAILTCCGFFLVTPVLADETPFPVYDVEQACRRGGLDQTACVRYVQPYYDTLRTIWGRVDEPIRHECVARYPDNIHARYVQILSCIDAEMQKRDVARTTRNPDRFRY